MKKQYLISLLALVAVSISLGNSFSSMTSFSNITNEQNIQNLEKYENEFPEYSIEQVSMGDSHGGAVVNDGENDFLFTWGSNSKGQLGLGDDAEREYNTPQLVTGLPEGDIEQIAMGATSSTAIVNDGQTDHLYTWGGNNKGQLGNGGTEKCNKPQEVKFVLDDGSSPKNIEIAANNKNVDAILTDNNGNDFLYTWGSNNKGQLGQGSKDHMAHPTPTKVTAGFPSGGDIEQVTTSGKSSAIVVDNQLYTWGGNKGQLGLGNTRKQKIPTKVDNLPSGDIEQISMGDENTAISISNNGIDSLYTCGRNDYGQLGLGNTNDQKSFTKVESLPPGDIEQISMGAAAAVIVNDEEGDHLYTWGSNGYGQLGLGDEFTETKYNTPQLVKDFSGRDIKQVLIYSGSTAAIVDNQLYTWGTNSYGQLGLGNNISYNTPQEVYSSPYIKNFISSPITEPNSKDVEIEYEFETNLNVQNVDITVKPVGGSSDDEIVMTSIPVSLNENFYKGTCPIKIDLYDNYEYTIDLNYIDIYGTDQKIENIDSGEFNLQGVENEPQITNGEVKVTSSTTASVDYVITENGTDPLGNELTLDKVTWIDPNEEGESKILDTSYDETGTLEAEDLDPNTTYENTIIIAEFIDEDFIMQTCPKEFTTLPGNTNSEVVLEGPVKIVSSTQATVNYSVTPGKDADGNDVTVQKVEWIDNSNNNPIATSRKKSGTLKARNLEPNTPYNTTIIAIMSDGSKTESVPIDEFSTEHGNEPSTIEQNGEVNVINSTSASVDYIVTPGKDINGENVTVSCVKWINESDDNNVLASSSDSSGTLTTNKLEANQDYDSTTLVAIMSDGSKTDSWPVSPFSANPEKIDSVINTATIAEDSITQNSAIINYNVTLGTEANGVSNATILSVELWDLDDDVSLGFDDTPTVDDLGDGSMEVSNLIANTTYNVELRIQFSNENDIKAQSVNSFITIPVDNPSVLTDVKVSEIKADNVTIDYTIQLGQDKQGNDLKLKSVELWDIDNDISLGFDDDLSLDENGKGSITVIGLIPETPYNTELHITTTNDAGITADEEKLTSSAVSFTTELGVPEFNNPDAVNIDSEDKVLQVEGMIISNGAMVERVNIIDTNIEEGSNIVGTQEIMSNDELIDYSVFTSNYDGYISHYQLQIIYVNDDQNFHNENDINDITDKTVINYDEDLSWLLNNGNTNNNNNNNNITTEMIILIVLIIIFIILLISWLSIYLFKKHDLIKN